MLKVSCAVFVLRSNHREKEPGRCDFEASIGVHGDGESEERATSLNSVDDKAFKKH